MRAPRRPIRVELAEPSEYQEQCAVASYLDGLGVLWCHVPNEDLAAAGARLGALAKAAGVKAGVPDILIFTPAPGAPLGAAIELKRRTHGDASDSQRQWLAGLAAIGWQTVVAHGALEAVGWLRLLGYSEQATNRGRDE